MFQHVNTYSRLTKDSSTAIDHIISNLNQIKSMVIHESISDHQIIISSFEKGQKNVESNDDSSKSVNRIHYAKTMSNLKELQWEQWIEKHKNSKVNEIYQSFDSIIQENIVKEKRDRIIRSLPNKPG